MVGHWFYFITYNFWFKTYLLFSILERDQEGNDEEPVDNDDERTPGPDRESEPLG